MKLTAEQRADFDRRAAAIGYELSVRIDDRTYEGADDFARLLTEGRELTDAAPAELDRQLSIAERRHAARQAARSPERSIDAGPDPLAETAALIAEANRRAEYAATVPGKLDRLIALFEETRDELRLARRHVPRG